MSEAKLPPPRHEASDIAPGLLWPLSAIMTAMILFALVLCWWAYPASLVPANIPDPAKIFAAPQLQRSPRADMASFKADEDKALNSYGWVDKEHGIVHVPIEDAMRKLATDGIPGWPVPEAPK